MPPKYKKALIDKEQKCIYLSATSKLRHNTTLSFFSSVFVLYFLLGHRTLYFVQLEQYAYRWRLWKGRKIAGGNHTKITVVNTIVGLALESVSFQMLHYWVGPGLIRRHWTRLERLARNKHSSLLRKSVNYASKRFIGLTPLVNKGKKQLRCQTFNNRKIAEAIWEVSAIFI